MRIARAIFSASNPHARYTMSAAPDKPKSSIPTTISANSTTTSNNQFSQSTSASTGQSVSDVGESASAGDVGGASSEGADVKKSIEINPITSQSASEVGLSIVAVLAILLLILVIAVGYFRDNDDKDKVQDLDKLFKEKV